MSDQTYRVIYYEDVDSIGDDFVTSPFVYRTVSIAKFNPGKREVTVEYRSNEEPISRREIERENRRLSEEEMLNLGYVGDVQTISIPRPPIDPTTLKCKCNELCRTSLSHSDENHNRRYAHCPTGQCNYFQWCDIAHIVCNCDKSVLHLIAGKNAKPANKGRPFFKCAKNKNGCGFFAWETDVQRELDTSWGRMYMSVEDALRRLIQSLRDPWNYPNGVPYNVLSTLAGHCSHDL